MSENPKILPDSLRNKLSQRNQNKQFRHTKVISFGDGTHSSSNENPLLDLCSNDYLGLASHPKLKERAIEYTELYGTGSAASRLISGTKSYHEELESALADFHESESALIFNSGFQANTSIIPALADKGDLILADKKSHNSIIQGCLASRADFIRFRHNDVDHLTDLLGKNVTKYRNILIITESVFSMDGDLAPLDEISILAQEYHALLFVDEAHAVGILGSKGRGLSYGISGIDIRLGTFGKSFGSFGAYVFCSKEMRDFLVNFAPGFIYSTSLPPAVIGASLAATELIPKMDNQRLYVQKLSETFRVELHKKGWDTCNSASQIIPILTKTEEKALQLADYLRNSGYYVLAIRPPTVPVNASRLRITLRAETPEHIPTSIIEKLDSWQNL